MTPTTTMARWLADPWWRSTTVHRSPAWKTSFACSFSSTTTTNRDDTTEPEHLSPSISSSANPGGGGASDPALALPSSPSAIPPPIPPTTTIPTTTTTTAAAQTEQILRNQADVRQFFQRTIIPQFQLPKVEELLQRLLHHVVPNANETYPGEPELTRVENDEPGTSKRQSTQKRKQKKISNKNNKSTDNSRMQQQLPLATVLQGMLRATNPNNGLQIVVLEYILLHTFPSTAPTSTKPKNATSTTDSPIPTTTTTTIEAATTTATAILSASSTQQWKQNLLATRERILYRSDSGGNTSGSVHWNTSHARANSLQSRTESAARLDRQWQRHLNETQEKNDDAIAGSASSSSLSVTALIQHLQTQLPPKTVRDLYRFFESYAAGSGADPVSVAPPSSKSRSEDEKDDDEGGADEQDITDGHKELVKGSINSPTTTSFSKTRLLGDAIGEPIANDGKAGKSVTIRKLSNHIEKITGNGHYHLVAKEIAQFFFVEPEHLGASDERFVSSVKRWEDVREKFVDCLMQINQALQKSSIEKADSIRGSGSSTDEKLSATAAPMRRVIYTTKFQPKTHLSFEALPLLQDTSTSNGADDTANMQASRIVFVDNLPIDVQDDVLKNVFSRCGELESVRIFNRREDLDPGPLSKAQSMLRQKKKIKLVGVYGQRWQRPCSPVYGLLTFADDLGGQNAINESLRIFGTIVNRHPVRSIPSSNMTRLYIDGVPEGHPCLDFEYLLGQALDPDFHICLNAGQNNRAMVESCEIKFPSFDIAFESYKKFQTLPFLQDDGNSCTLNWVRSPKDANLWWTRQLGFD